MKALLLLLLSLSYIATISGIDSVAISAIMADSNGLGAEFAVNSTITIDTLAVNRAASIAKYQSAITVSSKPQYYDIEQYHTPRNDTWIFLILTLLLMLITYLKLAFSNDFDTLIGGLFNANIATQLQRTAKGDLSLSSFLMMSIFILTSAVFTHISLAHYYPQSVYHSPFSVVGLIFLFTLFLVAKYILLKILGGLYEVQPVADSYLYHLSSISKSIGIIMIPALFVLYAVPFYFFDWAFLLSLLIFIVGAVMLVIRGLSTSFHFVYSSVYHYLIYICCGEIVPIFLLIKLLTKSAI